jgi:hypothetical protein
MLAEAKPEVPGWIVDIEAETRLCLVNFGATFGGNPLAGIDPVEGTPSCAGSPEAYDPDDGYYCETSSPPRATDPTCLNRACYVTDVTSGRTVSGGWQDWFEGIMARLTVVDGRPDAFRQFANLVRSGVGPATRVSSTEDSLYRHMTDASFTFKTAAEIFHAYDGVVKQGRPGVFLDAIDDRTSVRGWGELRTAWPGATATGRIDHEYDRDVFAVRFSAGVGSGRYRVRVIPDDPTTTDLVLDVWRHDPVSGSWAHVGRNDGLTEDSLEILAQPGAADQSYYVAVGTARSLTIDGWLRPYLYDSQPGAYVLTVFPTAADDYPDPAAGPTFPLASHGGRLAGSLTDGDVDGFDLWLPPNASVRVRVETPSVTTGGTVRIQRDDEASPRELTRGPLLVPRGGCAADCLESVERNPSATAHRVVLTLVGSPSLPHGMMAYRVSTQAVPPWRGDTCPNQWDNLFASAACKIEGLSPGDAVYRAGILLDSADADFYWLQAEAGDVIQVSAIGEPSIPRDAASLTVHAENGQGVLCLDTPQNGPDGRAQPRSHAIAESSAVANPDHANASALTFTVPAQWIWYPRATAPEIGWYRIKIAGVAGVASYPQQYMLVVQKNPERESFPEAF